MEDSLALQVVRAYVRKINAHNVDGLCELMTNDHRFVDAFGAAMHGREAVQKTWSGYFERILDYAITCEQFISGGDTIAIFGTASGATRHDDQLYPAHRWNVPAAWKVVVRGTRVAEWHEYMDTYPLRQVKS